MEEEQNRTPEPVPVDIFGEGYEEEEEASGTIQKAGTFELEENKKSSEVVSAEIKEYRRIALDVLNSKLAPRGVDTVEKIVVILQTGRELGFTPMLSLANIHVIEGRPTLGIHMVAALLKRSGVDYQTLEDYVPVIKPIDGQDRVVDYRTTIVFFRKGATDRTIEEKVSFTYKEAVQAGLATKTNWKNYPKAMTWNRCLVLGARRVAPDAILGMYEMTEMADVHDVPYEVEELK